MLISWSGLASDVNWNNPNNWDLERLPESGDDATVDDATVDDATVGEAFSDDRARSECADEHQQPDQRRLAAVIRRLILISTASLIDADLTLTGGTLTGDGDLTVAGTTILLEGPADDVRRLCRLSSQSSLQEKRSASRKTCEALHAG